MTPKVFGVVLAAGASRRMGRPKQLLPHPQEQHHTLLTYTLAQLLEVPCTAIAVVLGAYKEQIESELQEHKKDVHLWYNSRWQEGLASSLRLAAQRVLSYNPEVDGMLVLLVDQILLTASYLRQMFHEISHYPHHPIASAYQNTIGPPAYFPRHLLPYFEDLQGDRGAKSILLQHANLLRVLPWEGGSADWDERGEKIF